MAELHNFQLILSGSPPFFWGGGHSEYQPYDRQLFQPHGKIPGNGNILSCYAGTLLEEAESLYI